MINERALKDALLALATQNQTYYVMISSILSEVAALRETVRGLDPTFGDVMEQKKKEAALKQADIVSIVAKQNEEIIRRLKAGEVC